MKIKLCGMMKSVDIDYANELKPDYVGFVLAPSKRQLTRDVAAAFRKQLNADIPSVGVYVNEAVEAVADDFKKGIINIAQLHGTEDEDYISELKKLAKGLPIIKAIRVSTREDVAKSLSLDVDYLLFDTYKKGAMGGTGECFNWDMIKDVTRPYFLAGGLNPDNIRQAADYLAPFAVDLSSGIETDGAKDYEKMKQVVSLVKGTQL